MERYIQLRQIAGFKLANETLMLHSFITLAESHGDRHIRTDRVLEWASQASSPAQRNRRLSAIRHFAQALQAEDDRHQVPPCDAFGNAIHRRPPPYIFSPDEIARLIEVAGQLKPAGSIRPKMLAMLFGLLAATGLRISEALALRVQDVTADGLMILETKFQKSRLVPLHDTTRAVLDRYLAARAQTAAGSDALFVGINGKVPGYYGVKDVFDRVVMAMGLRRARNGGLPHIHDLRHTFAVRSLERFRGDRKAVSRHMTALSTYLGHTRVTDTYWYLEATPVLLEQIAEAAETLHREGNR
jgi:integrase